MLKEKTESERVIRCLNNCQESLDFTALDKMPSGTVSTRVTLVDCAIRDVVWVELA